jgi:HSP20 family molecular chaperone IbpA
MVESVWTIPTYFEETMMSKLPVHRQPRSLFPEFSELFAAFPSFAGFRPVFDTRLMRLEDEMKNGHYEVRAEIPGVDRPKTSRSPCVTGS